MKTSWELIFIVCLMSRRTIARTKSVDVKIDLAGRVEHVKRLPRFWTNTGLAPPAPVNTAGDYFELDDVKLNLEIIGSLPNHGVANVRIHWLLNLLSIGNSSTSSRPLPSFDFTRLDAFLCTLINDYRLTPTIEFMTTTLRLKEINAIVWEDLAYQLVARYIGRYGAKRVTKWKFETWNEPDLKGYNLLNFTLKDYEAYINGISAGIKAAERQFSIEGQLKLRGPAGLFKAESNHPFCWSVLENCNSKPDKCPIDIITFHRKGNGHDADEILSGSLDLIKNFSERFPNLTNVKYSNSEADPIKKWSEPRDFQADSRYAAVLVETVLEHWQARFDGRMKHLESISHDNSFLNFHPHFFTQRTLLARFQMNNTTPKHVQFVQKPVFAALGLLANLATFAGQVNELKSEKFSYVVTRNAQPNNFFACILMWSHVDLNTTTNKSTIFEIDIGNITSKDSNDELFYFVEGIDNKRTNPSAIYERSNRSPFPDINLLKQMRHAQNPTILSQPAKVSDARIILSLELRPPFVVSIRICSRNLPAPKRVTNLRLRKVNSEEILLFWSESFYRTRCIKTYEIFFEYSDQGYKQLETPSIPFLYHQLRHTIPGCFKIRSRDILDRVSHFSKPICFNNSSDQPRKRCMKANAKTNKFYSL